jgi:TP901 family phage tail tape measure protein
MTTKTIGIGIDARPAQQGARVVKSELKDIGTSADRAEKELKEMGRAGAASMRQVGTSTGAAKAGVTSLTGSVKGLAVTFISIAAAAQLVTSSINQALDFSKAVGEIGTLGAAMDGTAAKAREFATTFGTDATLQVKAFYQTYSAGASTLAEASETLEAANKLAVGGATDVETAVDGLTSVLNAYGDRVKSATDVSDSMFIAMKAGKTTIGELSSALGRVTPLAAAMGVTFDEVTAAVAALTKGGVTTKMAVTQLQAILANIVKPGSQAAKMAKELEIEFNAAGLAAMGFQGFMQNVIDKTGGASSKLAQLFGSVEGLSAVMAFASGAGEDLAAIIEEMKDKAGATEAAYETMSDMFDRKWNVAVAKANNIGLSFGNALLTVLVPAMTIVADNIDLVISGLALLSTKWAITKMALYAGSLTAIGAELGATAGAATLLGGKLGLIAWPLGIATAVAGAILLLSSRTSKAAEHAETYKGILDQLNISLEDTEDAATKSAAAIEKRGRTDLQAAQEGLALREAEIANQRVLLSAQKSLADITDARALQQVAATQKIIDQAEREAAIFRKRIEQERELIAMNKDAPPGNTIDLLAAHAALAGKRAEEAAAAMELLSKISFDGTTASAKKLASAMRSVGEDVGAADAQFGKMVNVQKTLEDRLNARTAAQRAETQAILDGQKALRDAQADIQAINSALEKLSAASIADLGSKAAGEAEASLESLAKRYKSLFATLGDLSKTQIAETLDALRADVKDAVGSAKLGDKLASSFENAEQKIPELQGKIREIVDELKKMTSKDYEPVITIDSELATGKAREVESALDDIPKDVQTIVDAVTKDALNNIAEVIQAIARIPRYTRSIIEIVTVHTDAKKGGSQAQAAASAPPPITPDFPEFASGGIATSPSIFGEAGPEAAVPLPDGSTIPVTLSGGGALGAIEVNTARTADLVERSLGYLAAIDSDILGLQSSIQSGGGGGGGGSRSGGGGSGGGGSGSGGSGGSQTNLFGQSINEIQRIRDVNYSFRQHVASLEGKSAATNPHYTDEQILQIFRARLPEIASTVSFPRAPGVPNSPIQTTYTYTDGTEHHGPPAPFANGGVIPASGPGNTDTRAMRILTRPDETIAIQTPEQRKNMVESFDSQFERGRQSGKSTVFNVTINVPESARIDRRSGQAFADAFTQRIRSDLSQFHGD